VLPDYYPDIFKVLKCTLTPCVISYSVSGNQLYCDGVVYIKVLYLGSESNRINCIEQRYTYSKTIELVKTVEEAIVAITPKTDYCNCRAVSGRRIDVRGAVSCKIKVSGTRETQMVTGAEGLGVETRKTSLDYCGEKLIASRQFVTREDIETGVGAGGISSIIHHEASVVMTEYKIVANKVVIKGEATIKALYLRGQESAFRGISNMVENDNEFAHDDSDKSNQAEVCESMEAVIPVSQIIDLNGVSEEHICFVNLSVMDCDLEIRRGDNDSNSSSERTFTCELTINCTVTAHLEKKVMPLIDMYSVDFESSFTKTVIKTESMPQLVERQLSLKGSVECNDGNLEAVYDTRCDISNVNCRVRQTDSNANEEDLAGMANSLGLVITGQANLLVVGRFDNNMPIFLEKTEQFELVAEVMQTGLTNAADGTDFIVNSNLQVVGTTYSITSDNKVEVRVVLRLNGCLYQVRAVEVVKEITVNTEAPKTRDTEYALKLYYAEKNENVWSIAKRYNTSADAIITENDMESEKITTPSMLLIPIV
jgi:LysM repeat protein